MSLRGVSYNKIDTKEQGIGLVAQEVQKILPDVVRETKDGYLGVAYGNIIGVLVESIKELNAKIEKLEATLNI